MLGLLQQLGQGLAFHPAQAGGLGAAAALGQGLGEVGEQHGKPQPQGNAEDKAAGCFTLAAQGLEPEQGGEDAAQVDHEHHRVFPLRLGQQFFQGIAARGEHDGAIKQR